MFGDILREERERQGLTIDDIERETSIRARYIAAIENADYEILPNEVYVRGFVKNYAEFLGFNTAEILQLYHEEKPKKAEPVALEATGEKPDRYAKPFRSGADFKERVQKSHRRQNIIVSLVVLIGFFIGSIFYFFGEEESETEIAKTDTGTKTETQAQQNNTPVSDAQNKNAQPSATDKKDDKKSTDANSDKKEQNAAQTDKKSDDKQNDKKDDTVKDKKDGDAKGTESDKNANPADKPGANSDDKSSATNKTGATDNVANAPTTGTVNLTASFSGRCWIQVMGDGKVIFEGTAERGQSFTWAANDNVSIWTGNAAAVDFSCNGRSYGVLGKEGEVIEKTFTVSGMK